MQNKQNKQNKQNNSSIVNLIITPIKIFTTLFLFNSVIISNNILINSQCIIEPNDNISPSITPSLTILPSLIPLENNDIENCNFKLSTSNISTELNNEFFTGDATAFGGSNNGGFCGFKENSFNYNSKIEVALNSVQWDNSKNCGRCVSIKYQDNEPVIALISDKCPECKFGDLDLFEESYKKIIKQSPGREKIRWNFIKCPSEFVSGDMTLRIDYINEYWLSINPENFACGILNIELSFGDNWIQMERNDNSMSGLYFNFNGAVKYPFQFRITSLSNEIILTPLYNELKKTLEINKQFIC